MFVVLIGTIVTLVESVAHPGIFDWSITAWLALTVLFANFAEAVAEGRGKAQADTLRQMRSDTEARRIDADGGRGGAGRRRPAGQGRRRGLRGGRPDPVRRRDHRRARVDRRVGHHRRVRSGYPRVRRRPFRRHRRDQGPVRPGRRADHRRARPHVHGPDDRPGGGGQPAEDAQRGGADHPARRADHRLPAGRGHPAAVQLVRGRHGLCRRADRAARLPDPDHDRRPAVRHRDRRHGPARAANVLAMSGRAVEAAGDVQTLLLDKTGTITLGNRMASAFHPVDGHSELELAEAAQLASLSDETPEGRSIVVLAKERFGIRQRELAEDHAFIPFTAQTRMSGLDVGGRQIRKGAAEAVAAGSPGRAARPRPSSTASSSASPGPARPRWRWPTGRSCSASSSSRTSSSRASASGSPSCGRRASARS